MANAIDIDTLHFRSILVGVSIGTLLDGQQRPFFSFKPSPS